MVSMKTSRRHTTATITNILQLVKRRGRMMGMLKSTKRTHAETQRKYTSAQLLGPFARLTTNPWVVSQRFLINSGSADNTRQGPSGQLRFEVYLLQPQSLTPGRERAASRALEACGICAAKPALTKAFLQISPAQADNPWNNRCTKKEPGKEACLST